MFRWNLMLKKLFAPTTCGNRPKARRPKTTTKLILEGLESRIVPSDANGNPLAVVSLASPPAGAFAQTVTTYLIVRMDQEVQLFGTIAQNAIGVYSAATQEMAQLVAYEVQRWDNMAGLSPKPPSPALDTAVTPTGNNGRGGSDSGMGRGNASGAGSGGGAPTTAQDGQKQPQSTVTQKSGGGSGSGTAIGIGNQTGGIKAMPMSGSGSYGSGVSGSGSGNVGTGTGTGHATVSGQVWLDSNGNGVWESGSASGYKELGYNGITVDLEDGTTHAVEESTITSGNGNYSFSLLLGPQAKYYLVHVELGTFSATFPGFNQINNRGNSAPFLLRAGGWRKIEAGILAMTVTTVQDDGTVPPLQNQTTLRDAIKTGNNGGGPLGLHTISFASQGKPLNGTITLQKSLDPITRSYNIVGPGNSAIIVDGNSNAGTIFTVNAGVTTTISGLTISGGSSANGGGIYNNGNLTLNGGDDISENQTTGNGGGIYNAAGASLTLGGSIVDGNSAANNSGGGIANYGTLNSTTSSIFSNKAKFGAGIANLGPAAQASLKQGTIIGSSNTASSKGGGLYNTLGTIKMTGKSSGAIKNNNAVAGGGLYVVSGTVTLTQVPVQTNRATANNGGGLYIAGGNVVVSDGTIASNAANNGFGGGIYNLAGTLTFNQVLNGSTIGPSNSANKGGGMYLGANSTTTFNGSVIVNGNKAPLPNDGPGVYWQNNATVNPNPPKLLTDNDDPNQTPVKGP